MLGLLSSRNTPLACGKSPAELLLGRSLRDGVPRYPDQSNKTTVQEKVCDIRGKEKTLYDQHAKDLKPMDVNTRVRVRSRLY